MSGDGIGPQITDATERVLQDVTGHYQFGLSFHDVTIGFDALSECGSTFPDESLGQTQGCDGIVLGPVSHKEYSPRENGGLNPSGELRKRLDLYANIRPALSRAGIAARPVCLWIWSW